MGVGGRCVVSLLILVTGNRQMAVRALSHASTRVFLQSHALGAQVHVLQKERPERWYILVLAPPGRAVHRAWGRQNGRTGPARPRCGAAVLPMLTSVRTVLPLLVLLVFLYLGTLGAEPLHLFRRGRH